MTERRNVELLSPAGSMDAFYGAIQAGADAIYLAGNEYGARAYADNFSDEELVQCIRYAHLFQKKVYLTVNTLVKDAELERLPLFLAPLVEQGLDGVIVQDFGVLKKIRECFPELPLHASTQMTVTGSYGAKMLRRYGVVRIVPARELTLEEIRHLVRESGMEVECFIHGAMCYSYSGQCLFSSMLGDRSGNRGRCAQPCRLPYRLAEREQYPLSMRDMCTLDLLPELVEAGIQSFKIEGRMKKAEYAAGVTAIYRKYLDLCLAGNWQEPTKQDWANLLSLYVRSEIGSGYYHCQNGRNMITLDSPAYNGADDELLKKIRTEFVENRKKLPVQIKGLFLLGERAKIQIRAISRKADWISVEGDLVEPAVKAPVTRQNLLEQLSKLGATSFALAEGEASLEIKMDDGIFYPLKKINELRRQATDALEEALIHERSF